MKIWSSLFITLHCEHLNRLSLQIKDRCSHLLYLFSPTGSGTVFVKHLVFAELNTGKNAVKLGRRRDIFIPTSLG